MYRKSPPELVINVIECISKFANFWGKVMEICFGQFNITI